MAEILPIKPRTSQGFDAFEALQTLSFATFILSSKGEVIFANIAAEQFFLSSSRGLFKKGIEGIFSDFTEFEKHIQQVINEQNSLTLHQISVEKSLKNQVLVDVTLAPFLSGDETRILLTIIGISKGANKAESVDRVASLADMLAHEVKNPLSGIRGAAQLLEQNASIEDKNLTQIICQECDRIRSLVESMESFSEDETLELKPENIHHILDHVLTISKAGFAEGVSIQAIYDPSLPLISANHDALVQLLLNLIKNAAESIKQAQSGGRGEIIIKTAYHHNSQISAITEANTPIEITISDNGTGIPEHMLHSLFEPFVTRKKVGKGLGLAMVKKIIYAHNGHIIAENTSSGAQFKLYLAMDNSGDKA